MKVGVTHESKAAGEISDLAFEVLNLVGHGLSNAEIAKRLIISEATAKTHVSNIFHKRESAIV